MMNALCAAGPQADLMPNPFDRPMPTVPVECLALSDSDLGSLRFRPPQREPKARPAPEEASGVPIAIPSQAAPRKFLGLEINFDLRK